MGGTATALTPPPAPASSQDSRWDMLGAFKAKYPDLASEPPERIYQHLVNPERFRETFPQYKDLDDNTIRTNVNRDFRDYISAKTSAFDKGNAPEPYWGFMPSHLWQQAVEGVSQLASGTLQLAKDVATHPIDKALKEDTLAPLEMENRKAADLWKQGRKSEAVGHYVASYLPFMGPWAADLGEQAGRGDIGGAIARGGSQIATGMATKAIIEGAPEGFRRAMRYATGAGDSALDRAARKVEAGNLEARQKYDARVTDITEDNKQALSAARQAHEARLDDIDTANARAQQKYQDAVSNVRAANAQAKAEVERGMASDQSAQQLTAIISNALPAVEEVATANAKAMYPKIEATVPAEQVNEALSDAVSEGLKGAGRVPSSIARALDKTAPEEASTSGPAVMGKTLDLTKPEDMAIYQRFKQSGTFTPEEVARYEGGASPAISFDDLHGIYSELGKELYGSRDLPGDSEAALSQAREGVRRIMTGMAKSEGKLMDFDRAQANWRVLENTFRNTSPVSSGGSPLARALRTRDPLSGRLRPDYVRQALADPKTAKIAGELLARYPDAAPLSDAIRTMSQQDGIAKAAPKTLVRRVEPSAPVEKPSPRTAATGIKELPAPPAPETLDVRQWREEQMERYATENAKLRPYNFMPWRIPFTVAQQIMSRMIADPRFRRWLAR